MRLFTLTLAGAALALPLAAQAQSSPLSSIFNCNNDNNRQGSGAIVGGLLGGLAGNQVAGDNDRTVGTVLGAALGAAAGSYVGCRMSGADTDQAQTATLNALNQNRSTTWSNSRTGTSGRIDIVSSYDRDGPDRRGQDASYRDGQGRRDDRSRNDRDDRGGYERQASLDDLRFARGVERPANHDVIDERYTAPNPVNIRSRPSARGVVVGQLRRGESFDAVARTGDRQWLLAKRNGVAVGYVNLSVVRFAGSSNGNDRYYRGGRDDATQMARVTCRVFDQSVATRDRASPTTQRFTACQNERGEWVVAA